MLFSQCGAVALTTDAFVVVKERRVRMRGA